MNIFKQKRFDVNLSQSNISAMMNIDKSTISKWENGKSFPKTQNLIKLVKIYKCSIDELYNNENLMIV